MRAVRHVSPRVGSLLYKTFKRNIGRTVTVAIVAAAISFLFAPAEVTIVLGVIAALIVAWWIVYLVNG